MVGRPRSHHMAGTPRTVRQQSKGPTIGTSHSIRLSISGILLHVLHSPMIVLWEVPRPLRLLEVRSRASLYSFGVEARPAAPHCRFCWKTTIVKSGMKTVSSFPWGKKYVGHSKEVMLDGFIWLIRNAVLPAIPLRWMHVPVTCPVAMHEPSLIIIQMQSF